MKSRLLSALDEIANYNGSANHYLLDPVIAEGEAEYGTKISYKEAQKRCKEIRHGILHNYSDFAISTIDSFNSRIVRSFGKDLDLPLNFEVSIDSDEILDEALANSFQRVGKNLDNAVSTIYKKFALTKMQNNQSWDIGKDLKKFSKNALFDDEKFEILEKMRSEGREAEDFMRIYEQIFYFKEALLDEFRKCARQADEIFTQYGLGKTDFSYGTIYNFFRELKHADEITAIRNKIGTNLTNMHESRCFTTKKEKRDFMRDVNESLALLLDEVLRLLDKYYEAALIAEEMMRVFFQLASVTTLQSEVDSVTMQKKKVLISDFNKRINQIVLAEPVPYIYERIGERYKHILIDEFQDTSRKQWINLIPLVSNCLQSGLTCMLVGDVKQAIYRFRGGNPSLMVNLPELPDAGTLKEEHETVFRQHIKTFSLDTNRRSAENIILFNNEFFTNIVKDNEKIYPEISRYYADVRQNVFKKGRGHVEIRLLNKDQYTAQNRKYEEETALQVFDIIQEVREKYRYDYKDIALIVQTNKQGSELANALIEKNVPVISNESLLLKSSPLVRLLVNFFKILVEPKSPTTKFEIADFLIGHFHPERLFAGVNYKQVSKACNEGKNKLFIKMLNDITGRELMLRKLSYQTLYEIAEEIVQTYGFQDLHEQQIYLQRFYDVLTLEGRKLSQSISEFLDFWEVKKDSLAVSAMPAADAVRILTVHKSKGLEFPVVILAHADWKFEGSREFWVEIDENPVAPEMKTLVIKNRKKHPLRETEAFKPFFEEEDKAEFIDKLNLLYVALTRAEERMYIIAKNENPKEESISFSQPKSCSVLFKSFVKNKDLTETDGKYIVYADETHNIHAKEKNTNFFELDFITTNHREKIKMRKIAIKPVEDEVNYQTLTDKVKTPNLAVIALSKLSYADDLNRRIEQMLDEGLLNDLESRELDEKLQRVIFHPQLKTFFQKHEGRKILLEKEILGKNIAESFTISRIVLDGKKANIMDFKRGKFAKEDESKLKKAVRALKQMQFDVEKVFFINTETEEVIYW
jgi:ATP-dependent exoDNAse (exonuclease V) beta subunit